MNAKDQAAGQVLELNPHLQSQLPKDRAFDWVLNCPGTVHRQVKHRRTVETEIGGRRYFIKVHRGCGWREVLKDWLQLRPPIISARTERDALAQAQRLGIRTAHVAGWGERGTPPAHLESFLITDALEDMTDLEALAKTWGGLTGPRQAQLKRALLHEVARIARILHEGGMNHRDFYLCHFMVKDRRWSEWEPGQPLELILMDLHRVQMRSHLPRRWQVKDLGGLLFSALDAGLTRRDLLRFMAWYQGRAWRESLAADRALWRRVWRNAERLYLAVHGRPAPQSLQAPDPVHRLVKR